MEAKPEDKKSTNWVDMSKGRPKKTITLEQEQQLIRDAQAGDKKSMDALLRYYEPFVQQVAKRLAWFTGATRSLEDLIQHGRIALFEKALSYDFAYIEKRRLNPKDGEPEYKGARLSSYAFREIRRRMYQEACISLEIVRLPQGTLIQRAHKQLDEGGDPEEIADRLGLRKDVVSSLMRHTIGIDYESTDLVDNRDPDENILHNEKRRYLIDKIWTQLDVFERMALCMLYLEPNLKTRAVIFRVNDESRLKAIEAKVLKLFKVLQ